MQWLFELSVACALIALASIPLMKFMAAPVQRLRRSAPRGGKFWLDATLVPALARARKPVDTDAAS
jgi:peptidoglycan/LPS O-acetylase OafA/YrhL